MSAGKRGHTVGSMIHGSGLDGNQRRKIAHRKKGFYPAESTVAARQEDAMRQPSEIYILLSLNI